MLYKSGYAETMIGDSRRHLGTSELERNDRFSGTWSLGPIKSKLKIRSATDQTLSVARLMVDLLPKATSFAILGGTPSNKEHPTNERQKLEKS